MTGNPIGIVICRVGAILLLVSALQGVGFVLVPLLESSDRQNEFLVMSALLVLAPIVTGIVLWIFAEQVSSSRVDSPRVKISDTIGPADLVRIGTYLIGMYALVFGVVHAFQAETLSWAQSSIFEDSEHLIASRSAHTIGSRVSYAAQIVLGLALLIWGKANSRK